MIRLAFMDIPQVQERLVELHFDPGPLDGRLSAETRAALWGFQKVNGLKPVSRLTAKTLYALDHPREVVPLVKRGPANRVEVDLGRQLMFVYAKGELALITHVSTGANRHYCEKGVCGYAVTHAGDFRVYKKVRGWQRGRLGAMYKPMYFDGGIALHGSTRVPLRPASHGCVRIPLHTAGEVFHLVRKGMRVYVRP